MQQTVSLKMEVRKQAGSHDAARLRKSGKLPAVIYGHKQAPVSVSFDGREFLDNLHHGHRVFNVNLPEGQQTLLVKDLQYDHLGKEVIHADMVRVDLSERVTVSVPLEFRGTPKGTHAGGVLDELMTEIEIECPVTEIPEQIIVNIKELDLDQQIAAGQIELPANCSLKTDAKALVVTCHEVVIAKTTEELQAEMPAAPEVITERAPKEEGEGDSKSK